VDEEVELSPSQGAQETEAHCPVGNVFEQHPARPRGQVEFHAGPGEALSPPRPPAASGRLRCRGTEQGVQCCSDPGCSEPVPLGEGEGGGAAAAGGVVAEPKPRYELDESI